MIWTGPSCKFDCRLKIFNNRYHQRPSEKLKMHNKQILLGLHHRLHWGAYSVLQPLAAFQGQRRKGREE